jgi:large subunit ribosomal protein L30e
MIDVNKQLKIAVKTGKVEFGCKSALDAARAGKAKLIVLASNCPERYREDIAYYAKLSQIPIYVYSSTSIDLGAACGKPFAVSALTVKESGDSEILRLAEAQNVDA